MFTRNCSRSNSPFIHSWLAWLDFSARESRAVLFPRSTDERDAPVSSFLSVVLLPDKAEEVAWVAQDVKRALRAGVVARSEDQVDDARLYARIRQTLLHADHHVGLHGLGVSITFDNQRDRSAVHLPFGEQGHKVQMAVSRQVPVAGAKQRSFLLLTVLVSGVHLLVDGVHHRRGRQSLRFLRVPDLRDIARHGRAADEPANRRGVHGGPEDVRRDAPSAAAVRTSTGGGLRDHYPKNDPHQRRADVRVDLWGQPGTYKIFALLEDSWQIWRKARSCTFGSYVTIKVYSYGKL